MVVIIDPPVSSRDADPERSEQDQVCARVVADPTYTAAMRTVVATTPRGVQWRVRVVWQPRWRALARRFGGWRRNRRSGGGSGGSGGSWDPTGAVDFGDDLLVGIAVVIGLILFGLLFWFLLLPLLLLVLDMLVVIVLLMLAIPARVLLRRPWTIEAVAGAERFETHTIGWRRALRVRDEIAQRLRDGPQLNDLGEVAAQSTRKTDV
jgi:hypothetical protein